MDQTTVPPMRLILQRRERAQPIITKVKPPYTMLPT